MEKQKYYVNLASHEISKTKYHNNDSWIIYATEDEVRTLRTRLNDMDSANMGAFWRAHVPFMPYHHDAENDAYDSSLTETFQMLYELGDEQTKAHIENMNILNEKHM